MKRARSKDAVLDWHSRPYGRQSPGLNALTIDVEDYFQVEAFFPYVKRESWNDRECRVEANTDRLLGLFSQAGTTATFFTLGWVAQRYPQLVRRIVDGGHELGSHGMAHIRADRQSRTEFLDDVTRSKKLLEDVGGVAVKGYRATSFSITRQNLWALSALDEAGYLYSSSTFPIAHDLYGIPEQPRFAFHPFADSKFVEIPVTTTHQFGRNWPAGGGGYFRLLPYALSRRNMRHVQTYDRQPCCFYLHPWEIDPGQPRIPGITLKSAIRHYLNLGRVEGRMRRLLRDFRWARMDRAFDINSP